MRPSIPSPTRYAAYPAAVAALVGCLGVTGCTGTSHRSTPPVATTRSAPLPAIAHLSAIICQAAADGEWSFTATVTNRDQVTEDYTVTASLVRKSDGHVAGSRAMTTELAPGRSTTVTASSFFAGESDGLVCVPSVLKKPA
ncbi:MAG: hypothetical protein ABI243_09700 [Lapillicoccus sp.]